jgi:hypothetical protein
MFKVPAQKKYQQIVENSGGIYLIVTCIDDLFKWWDENLVLTK